METLTKAAPEYKAGGVTYKHLAEKYNIPAGTIYDAVKGNSRARMEPTNYIPSTNGIFDYDTYFKQCGAFH